MLTDNVVLRRETLALLSRDSTLSQPRMQY
jgi:hypothetical protein